MEERKERFLKVYVNIPFGLRRGIVLVIDKKPISWDVAFVEIDNDTPLSKIILEKLDKLGLI